MGVGVASLDDVGPLQAPFFARFRNLFIVFLEAQRASILAFIDGLGVEALTTAVLPSG